MKPLIRHDNTTTAIPCAECGYRFTYLICCKNRRTRSLEWCCTHCIAAMPQILRPSPGPHSLLDGLADSVGKTIRAMPAPEVER